MSPRPSPLLPASLLALALASPARADCQADVAPAVRGDAASLHVAAEIVCSVGEQSKTDPEAAITGLGAAVAAVAQSMTREEAERFWVVLVLFARAQLAQKP